MQGPEDSFTNLVDSFTAAMTNNDGKSEFATDTGKSTIITADELANRVIPVYTADDQDENMAPLTINIMTPGAVLPQESPKFNSPTPRTRARMSLAERAKLAKVRDGSPVVRYSPELHNR